MFNFAHPEFEAMINAMWAVDDFTTENGATHVVPGSPSGRSTGWPAARGNAGRYKRGSVLIYLGSLHHGGGANRTNGRAPAS